MKCKSADNYFFPMPRENEPPAFLDNSAMPENMSASGNKESRRTETYSATSLPPDRRRLIRFQRELATDRQIHLLAAEMNTENEKSPNFVPPEMLAPAPAWTPASLILLGIIEAGCRGLRTWLSDENQCRLPNIVHQIEEGKWDEITSSFSIEPASYPFRYLTTAIVALTNQLDQSMKATSPRLSSKASTLRERANEIKAKSIGGVALMQWGDANKVAGAVTTNGIQVADDLQKLIPEINRFAHDATLLQPTHWFDHRKHPTS